MLGYKFYAIYQSSIGEKGESARNPLKNSHFTITTFLLNA